MGLERLGLDRRSPPGLPGGKIQIGQAGSDGYPLVQAENLVTILQYGQSPYRLEEIQLERQ